MASVRDFMQAELTILSPSEDVLGAMREMIDAKISGAPVVDDHGNLVGILTQRDCLTVAFQTSYHGERAGTVRDHMSFPVETVSPSLSLAEVLEKFLRSPYRRFPVVLENQLVGQISRRDVLRAVLEMA
ncbi:MAG: CBS domain-containing protein [Myxococcales bacterium]|nr:CBS domain-containing protein [Myxococcales bacterium]